MIHGYKPEHFNLHELVSADSYNRLSHAHLWGIFNPLLLWTIDQIREFYNKPMTINNWFYGGDRQYSGLRMPGEYPASGSLSQHRFGNAVDFYIKGIEPAEIRQDIKENPNNDIFQFITAIEDFNGMNWVHIDMRNWDKDNNGLLVFKP